MTSAAATGEAIAGRVSPRRWSLPVPRNYLRVRLLVLALGVLSLLIVGCTEEEPVEPPAAPVEEAAPVSPVGGQVSVVVQPRTLVAEELLEALDDDLARLQSENEPDIRLVRSLIPDEQVFISDLAELSARGDVDLTCVLGPVGRQIVSDLRALHPAERFCAVTPNDAPAETEDGVDVVAVRTVELGHALGVGGARLAGSGAVALALGGDEFERGRFLEGLQAGLGATPAFEVDGGLDPADAIDAAVEEGARVVIVGTGLRAPDYLDAALEADVAVVAHAALVSSSTEVALTWRLRWDVLLAPVIDRLMVRDELRPLDLGVAEGVFDVAAGAAGTPGLSELLEEVLEQLADGTRDPYTPAEPVAPVEAPDVEAPEEDAPGEEVPGEAAADEEASASTEQPEAPDSEGAGGGSLEDAGDGGGSESGQPEPDGEASDNP